MSQIFASMSRNGAGARRRDIFNLLFLVVSPASKYQFARLAARFQESTTAVSASETAAVIYEIETHCHTTGLITEQTGAHLGQMSPCEWHHSSNLAISDGKPAVGAIPADDEGPGSRRWTAGPGSEEALGQFIQSQFTGTVAHLGTDRVGVAIER